MQSMHRLLCLDMCLCVFVVNRIEQMQDAHTHSLTITHTHLQTDKHTVSHGSSEASRQGCELHAKEAVCINLPKWLAKV